MQRIVDYAGLGLRVVADECRRSFFYFVKTFWPVIIQEQPVYNWHISFLCEELQKLSVYLKERKPKPYDLIINIPPGTTKSTIVTIMYPAWLWTIDPTLQIITNSYSGGLSIEHAMKSKDIICSDKFRLLFTEVVIRHDKSGKQHYANTMGGFRYATSTNATITGYHAHVIINDDPVNPKQANSDIMRNAANEHLKTLSSRKVNKANTPMVTVMQRLHVDDVTGYQLNRKGERIRHICLPAELSQNVKPSNLRAYYVDGLLDPIRLNRNVLEESKNDLGSVQYAGQFEQSPTVSGGNIVKSEWFGHISRHDFDELSKSAVPVFFIDTAYTDKSKNDPTGIITTHKIGNDLYISHAEKVNLKFPDLLRFIEQYVTKHGYIRNSTIRVEPKANGLSVIDQMRETTGLNIKATPTPKDSKETRLNSVSPTIECGRIILVDGGWNEDFVDEICGFPNKPHDEYVDILFYAIDFHLSHPIKPIDKSKIARMAY